MAGTQQVCFDIQLMRHIADSRDDKAKCMINHEYHDLGHAVDGFGSLLHYAAKIGNLEITLYLIQLGSDIDCLGQGKKTPLMIAVDYNRASIVKALLEAGANLDIVSNNGKSALQMAFHPRYFANRIIQLFTDKLKTEAPTTEEFIERLCAAGCTLHHAVILKEFDVLKTLLHRGRDANSTNHEGKTALHIAAEVSAFEMVKLLIEYGADVKALNKYDRGPLCYVEYSDENLAVAQLLLEEGADSDIESDFNNHTPLFALYVKKTADSVEYLPNCISILLRDGVLPQNAAFNVANILDGVLDCYEYIHCLIAHVAMLGMRGTLPADLVMQCNGEQHRRRFLELKKFYDMCRQMLKIKIFGSLTLLNLLLDYEHKMKHYMRNEKAVHKIWNFCNEHVLKHSYSYYYIKLMSRISRASRIVKLEDEAVPIICNIYKKSQNECYVIARKIVGYLNERDLRQLCQV